MQPCATALLVVAVYAICTGATLPYFLNMRVVSCTGDNGEMFYELRQRWSRSSEQHTMLTVYMTWWWPCVAVFGPLAVLLACNLRLVLTLRSSLVTQCRCPSNAASTRQKLHSYRVTLILIIIVFMAIMLLMPAELLKLINPYKTWGDAGFIIADVANVLQATNFAFNFMLYCAVDRRFRIIVKELFTVPWCCGKDTVINRVEIPLRNGHRKLHTSKRTFTFKPCKQCERQNIKQNGKQSTKTSILKKKIII